jgi:predicted enzyme involved in methoxymalonyl-ACP biosynthesis
VLLAEDRFTHYGLIGAAWVAENCIEHMVMSCRALGLGLEDAFLAFLAGRIAEAMCSSSRGEVLAKLTPTEANAPCHEVYARNGFVRADDRAGPDTSISWLRRPGTPPRAPAHIALSYGGDVARVG